MGQIKDIPKKQKELKSKITENIVLLNYGDVFEIGKHRLIYGDATDKNNIEKLSYLLSNLNNAKIRLFYKDITTADVKEVGVTVVRVLSPELSLIHGDENIPFLGGRTNDIKWRYSNLKCGMFPNKYPHPLG
jgi:hypothetical protein